MTRPETELWPQYARQPRYDDFCICAVCGFLYAPEDKSDQRKHGAYHRKVLQVYEPKPNPRLSALYGEHGAFVPI
jgi:hypothetical protein